MKKTAHDILSQKKNALFDLDGTLLPTHDIWRQCDREYLKLMGIELDPNMDFNKFCYEVYLKNINSPDPYAAIFEEINKHFNIDMSGKDAHAIVTRFAEQKMKELDFITGAGKLLHQLKRNSFGMGLVTSSPRKSVDIYTYENQNLINNANLSFIFGQNTVTCEDVAKRKPDPEPYLVASDMFKFKIKDTVVFEDSPEGVQSATDAGFDTILVYDEYWDAQRKQLLEMTPYHINSYHELLRN
ncbi:MAG: HAD family phosphatase [Firmicutes bacterium]|nr:HAD family phosphatase [Bacillota bacterium]